MWKVKIGATENGMGVVGARACRVHDAITTAYVYASQFRHRVVARDDSGQIVIITPTEASKKGYSVVGFFLGDRD